MVARDVDPAGRRTRRGHFRSARGDLYYQPVDEADAALVTRERGVIDFELVYRIPTFHSMFVFNVKLYVLSCVVLFLIRITRIRQSVEGGGTYR